MAEGPFDDGGTGFGQATPTGAASVPGAASIPGVAPTGTVQSGIYAPTPYDPNNPQPYRPTTMPGVEQLVPNIPPPEQPVRDLGATTKAGGVAYLGDQLLRGYMQGRAVSQANQAIQLNKTSQGLQSNLNQASQELYQLAQAGIDPKSQQFQDAQNRVNAAWQSWMQFAGQHVQGLKIDKKTGQPVPQGNQNLLQRMFNQQDPAQIAPAWYEAMQQTGPPVLHQIAPMLTDEYRARAQTRAATTGTQAQTGLVTAQTGQIAEQNQLRYQQLLQKAGTTGGLNPDEQQEFDALRFNTALTGKGGSALLNKVLLDWKPSGIPTFNKDAGVWQQTLLNPTTGQTRVQQFPKEFSPSAAALRGLETYGQDSNGTWQVIGTDYQGNPTTKPLFAGQIPTQTTSTRQTAGPLGTETFTNTTVKGPVRTASGAAAGTEGFAQAISAAEGFGTPNSIPTRANNPGSLELGDVGHGVLTAANGQKITVFGSQQEGQAALDKQLGKIFSGTDPQYPPSMTLDQFGQKYSGGDAGYGARIAQSLGVPSSTTLGQLAQSQAGAGGTGAGTGTGVGAVATVPNVAAAFPGGSVPRMYAAPLAKAQSTLAEASKAASIANSPDTANNGTAQYLLLTSLFHSAQGRSPNMTELTKIMGTAGWGASLEGWVDKLRNGTMSPELFDQIVRFANTNRQAAGKELDDLVSQAQGASGRDGKQGGSTTTTTPPPPPAAAAGTGTGFNWQQNFTPAAQ